MFLDWVSSLDLLEHDKETNILKDFSLPVRRILVSQVVNFFLDPNTPAAILTTPTHVHWVMECVGQGFLLPIEDMTVIVSCIDLYKKWLMDPKTRPPPIQANEQHFIRIMIQHFSLLFTPRPGMPKESTDVHTVLCQRVLAIFLDFGRTCKLSAETWDVVLKLQLGVCDCMLGSGSVEETQTKPLAPLLLKVLFEMWLHARTTDPALWGSLVKLAANWLHLMPVAAQWNATTLGLTNRLLTLLYPASDFTQYQSVIIKTSESDSVSIDLVPDHVYYAWHRMLHVLGNLNSLTSPSIFVCAMTGLNNLVCQFLKVGRTPETRDKPDVPRPDGNTILHIFGSWLFEAIKLNRTTFDEGTAIAVETLNHIFNACQHSGFAPVYLSSFYSCMAEALASEGRVMMSAVQYGQWLLFSELPGARVLVPLYISAISKILPLSVPYHPSVSPPDVIRRCCIKILGALICLPNRFGNLAIPQITTKPLKLVNTEKSLSDITCYREMLPHIAQLLISGVSTEKSSQNTELLLWYLPLFLREISTTSLDTPITVASFATSATEVIVSSVCGNVWNNEVCQAACRVLSVISRMYSLLPNGPELGYTLTKALCEFASSRIGLTASDEELAASVITCVTDWTLVDQWLLVKRDAFDAFIDCCMLGLGIREHPPEPDPIAAVPAGNRTTITPPAPKKQRNPPGERLKQAAQHGLLNVLHNMGNFPPAIGSSRISSLVSEEDVLLKIKEADPSITDPEDFVRYFIVDESFMLSIIDIPNGEGDPSCVIVIRDRTGKYVWAASKPYLPFNPKKESELDEKDSDISSPTEGGDDLPRTPTTTRHALSSSAEGTPASPPTPLNNAPIARTRALVSEGSSGDLHLLTAVEADVASRNRTENFQDLFTYINSHTDDTFLTLAERVMETEKSLLVKHKDETMAVSIKTHPPARRNPYSGPNKLQLGRQLLASLGLFSQCHSKVVPLHPGPALSACVKAMDMISERTQHKIGVVYAAKGQKIDEVFANVNGSKDYHDFLSTLGWPVHVPTHKGFLGGLDPKGQHGLEAPYFSTYATEIVFLVTSLMPNNFSIQSDSDKPNAGHKRALLRGAPVVIVWSEDHKFDTTSLTEAVPLQIVIIPQSSGMFRVKILKTTSITKINVGPIAEDVIVSKQVLGDVIRETAIVAAHLIAPTGHPYATRRSYIEQMSRSFKSPNMTLDAFYGKIFGPMSKAAFPNPGQGGPNPLPPKTGGRPGYKNPAFPMTPPPPPVPSMSNLTPDKFDVRFSSFDSLPSHLSVGTPPSQSPSQPQTPQQQNSSTGLVTSHSQSQLQSSPSHTPPDSLSRSGSETNITNLANNSPTSHFSPLASSGESPRSSPQPTDPAPITRPPSFGSTTAPIPIPQSSASTSTPTKTSTSSLDPTSSNPPSPDLPPMLPTSSPSPGAGPAPALAQAAAGPAAAQGPGSEKMWSKIRPSPRAPSPFGATPSPAAHAEETQSAQPAPTQNTSKRVFEIGRKKQ